MRGKERLVSFEKLPSGITPAYAGKSFVYMHKIQAYEDHPRLCGEKLTRSGVCGII